jgi:hypothetical protein
MFYKVSNGGTPTTITLRVWGGAVINQPYVGDRNLGDATISNFPCKSYNTATIKVTITGITGSYVEFGAHKYTANGTYNVDISELETVTIHAHSDKYHGESKYTEANITFK